MTKTPIVKKANKTRSLIKTLKWSPVKYLKPSSFKKYTCYSFGKLLGFLDPGYNFLMPWNSVRRISGYLHNRMEFNLENVSLLDCDADILITLDVSVVKMETTADTNMDLEMEIVNSVNDDVTNYLKKQTVIKLVREAELTGTELVTLISNQFDRFGCRLNSVTISDFVLKKYKPEVINYIRKWRETRRNYKVTGVTKDCVEFEISGNLIMQYVSFRDYIDHWDAIKSDTSSYMQKKVQQAALRVLSQLTCDEVLENMSTIQEKLHDLLIQSMGEKFNKIGIENIGFKDKTQRKLYIDRFENKIMVERELARMDMERTKLGILSEELAKEHGEKTVKAHLIEKYMATLQNITPNAKVSIASTEGVGQSIDKL